jgi:hypothetical protein
MGPHVRIHVTIFCLSLSLHLSFHHLEAAVRLLACAPQPALATELETDRADEVTVAPWMARQEIDTPRMSPRCGAHGDAPLHHAATLQGGRLITAELAGLL